MWLEENLQETVYTFLKLRFLKLTIPTFSKVWLLRSSFDFMLLSLFPINPFFFLLGLVRIDCCYLHPKIPESYKNWQERMKVWVAEYRSSRKWGLLEFVIKLILREWEILGRRNRMVSNIIGYFNSCIRLWTSSRHGIKLRIFMRLWLKPIIV